MANEIRYKNVDWAENTPIAGERLATNGYYTGQHKGSVLQDDADDPLSPYLVETTTIRCGTMLGDDEDANFPEFDLGEDDEGGEE